jgi:CheY-like chemotaxis protein
MKPRILLAEDNPANVYLATFLLEQQGYTIEHASNGIECLACVRAHPPSLVLMDLQMPIMDGYEAARELKADPATARIPLIAVTAFAMPGDRHKAITAGFQDYIEKPYDPETFTARVASHLRPPTPIQ